MTQLNRHPQFPRRSPIASKLLMDLDRAAGYEPRILAVPNASNVDVAARSTYEEQVNIDPGSWLWALSGNSNQAAGFKAQITDMQTGANLASKPINYHNCTGQGSASGVSSPLHILSRPRLVMEPGLLAVQLINLAAVQNTIQLCLWTAVPLEPDAEPLILTDEEELASSEAVERIHRFHQLHRLMYPTSAATARPVVGTSAARPTAGGSMAAPWDAMPAVGRPFHHEQVVNCPAPGTADFSVLSVPVPFGWVMAIKAIHCRYTGSGFQDGSGDLIWRLSVDGAYLPGYDNLTTTQGSSGQPRGLGEAAILASSNQLVRFTVSVDAGAGIPTGSAAQIVCILDGWYFPENLM